LILRRCSITHRKSIEIKTDKSPNSEIGLDSCARCASYSNGYYGRYYAATIFRFCIFLGRRPQNKNGARITVLLRLKELHRGILLTLEVSLSRCADGITRQQGVVGHISLSVQYTPRARHQTIPARRDSEVLTAPSVLTSATALGGPSAVFDPSRCRRTVNILRGLFHRRLNLNSPQAGNECTGFFRSFRSTPLYKSPLPV
jgi:hypothetical protein